MFFGTPFALDLVFFRTWIKVPASTKLNNLFSDGFCKIAGSLLGMDWFYLPVT
jgi:hypothetical protein